MSRLHVRLVHRDLPLVTNVRIPFDMLHITAQHRKYHQPQLRPISAIDTETANGSAFLICDDSGNYLYPERMSDTLDFLFRDDRHKKTNFFYNLDFDVNALLYPLGRGALSDLWHDGFILFDRFRCELIPSKYFALLDGRKRVQFFDLAQFFNTSLDNACKTYLGEGKHDIDAMRINNDEEYRRVNKTKILAYCLQDAYLTRRLAELTYQLFDSVGIESNLWYSRGYIAERYFMKHTKFPRIHFKQPQEYAYYSYAGGRFEVFQRGYFPKSYKYDITSAYPYAMTTLPNLDVGKWVYDTKYDENADLAFIHCLVKSNSAYVQPLHYKIDGLVTYPEVHTHRRVLTKTEYDFIVQYALADIDIIDVWHFYAHTDDRPFNVIHDLFRRRRELKDSGDSRQHTLKIVMNSIYGKTIQINPRRPDEHQYRTGNLFNPAYAAEITAKTRIELMRVCIEHDVRPLAFFTDAIITDRPLPIITEGLGGWTLEKEGDSLIIGSGVYAFRTHKGTETLLRGFRPDKRIDLFEVLEEQSHAQTLKLHNVRPVTLGEYVTWINKLDENTLNQWLEREKRINLNFDRKRKWERNFRNASDALRNTIDSTPLLIP